MKLKRSEAEVLYALICSSSRYALKAGDLARECFVTTGTLTKRVDRLTDRGLVIRRQDGEDGRIVIIQLTSAGKRAAENAMSALLSSNSTALDGLIQSERQQLATLLRKIKTEVDRP
jgi:DNA-binding MarR family transcriptional regulator